MIPCEECIFVFQSLGHIHHTSLAHRAYHSRPQTNNIEMLLRLLLPRLWPDLLWVRSSLYTSSYSTHTPYTHTHTNIPSYPASVISVTLGQPTFLQYMGLLNAEGKITGNLLNTAGAISGIFQAGASLNVILTAIVLDRWGRKASIYYNSTVGLFGGALIVGARNIEMFLGGRFFAGMSSFGYLVLTPIYCTELAPPKYRGFFVGLNAVFIATGYAIAAWTGVGFSYSMNPTTQWRGPLGMYLPWPALLMVIAFFSPESPRWLMLQGREEEARKVIFDLHTVKGDDVFATQEFEEIKKQTIIDQTLETSWVCSSPPRHLTTDTPHIAVHVHETFLSPPCSHHLFLLLPRPIHRYSRHQQLWPNLLLCPRFRSQTTTLPASRMGQHSHPFLSAWRLPRRPYREEANHALRYWWLLRVLDCRSCIC